MIFNDGQKHAETILGKESIMELMTEKNLSLLFPCALLCIFLNFILKFSLNQLPVSCYLQSKMATTLQSQPLKPTNRFSPTRKTSRLDDFFPPDKKTPDTEVANNNKSAVPAPPAPVPASTSQVPALQVWFDRGFSGVRNENGHG